MNLRLLGNLALIAAVCAPAEGRAQLDPGTMGIIVYEILDLEDASIGWLVTTGAGYSGGTWAASSEYWFWEETSPLPDDGFLLEVYGTTPPGGLSPANAIEMANGSFPYNTGTCDLDEGTGDWFRVKRGSTQFGWVQDLGAGGLHWYIVGDEQQHATPKYPLASETSGALYLRFEGPIANPPSTLSNCSDVLNELE